MQWWLYALPSDSIHCSSTGPLLGKIRLHKPTVCIQTANNCVITSVPDGWGRDSFWNVGNSFYSETGDHLRWLHCRTKVSFQPYKLILCIKWWWSGETLTMAYFKVLSRANVATKTVNNTWFKYMKTNLFVVKFVVHKFTLHIIFSWYCSNRYWICYVLITTSNPVGLNVHFLSVFQGVSCITKRITISFKLIISIFMWLIIFIIRRLCIIYSLETVVRNYQMVC
jgi:hypothetical protein